MKKLLLLLCVSHTAFAAHDFSGFYVKGGLGATLAQYDLNHDFTNEIISFITFSRPSHLKLNTTNIAGLLGAGYSYQFNAPFILSAEVTAGLTHAEDSHHIEFVVPNPGPGNAPIVVDSEVQATLKNDFAILLKPGFVVKETTQFYALLGARWGNFETELDSQFDFQQLFFGSSTDSASGYTLGFTAGVGIERMMDKHFSFGLEYAYTSYGEIPSPHTAYATNTAFGTHGNVTDQVKIDTGTHNLLLDVAYRF